MSFPFNSTYWGGLPHFQIPYLIAKDDVLTLTPTALALLLVLYQSARGAQYRKRATGNDIQVKITQETISQRVGRSENQISTAAKELVAGGLIRLERPRKKYGEFGSNEYTLCNPVTQQPLSSGSTNFVHGSGLRYFTLPDCIVKEHEAAWSVANMTGSELKVYVAACWLASKRRAGRYAVTVNELKKVSGLSTLPTAEKALAGVLEKALLSYNDAEMVLHDPFTGQPPHVQTGNSEDDPANYKYGDGSVRWNANTGKPEDVERLLELCEVDFKVLPNGQLMISCPFHADNNPSCSVDPKKRVFYCFGCQAKGTLVQLLAKLRGLDNASAYQLMAEASGQKIEFRERDKNAEAIYSYLDERGKLLKQVLRNPGKKFAQRRPAPGGGWIWDAEGVPPSLYNLHRLKKPRDIRLPSRREPWDDTDTVAVLEGEKDCDSFNALEIRAKFGSPVIAVTSGGANSWVDQLADHLKDRRVVIMSDADEAGERFRAEIEASLQSRGIVFRVVSFADAGAKDVGDFLTGGGTKADVTKKIGWDWVRTGISHPSSPTDDYDPDTPLPTI